MRNLIETVDSLFVCSLPNLRWLTIASHSLFKAQSIIHASPHSGIFCTDHFTIKKNALWKIITNTERVINIRCKKTQNKIHINILAIIHHCKTFALFQWPYHRTCANNTLLLTTVTVSLNFKKLSFFFF